jgi:hypothetical protein
MIPRRVTMKIKISIPRRELAKPRGKETLVIEGEAKPLPDEARLIAEAIQKILSKEGI